MTDTAPEFTELHAAMIQRLDDAIAVGMVAAFFIMILVGILIVRALRS